MTIRLNGSTSGYVEIDAPAVAGTGLLTLPTGTGTLLTSEGGKVLQVVSSIYATETTTTSLSFVATGMSATITPSSITSKVLILHSGNGGSNGTAGNNGNGFTIFRGSTAGNNLSSSGEFLTMYGDIISTYRLWGSLSMSWLDSPATISPQVYTAAMRSSSGQSAVAQRGGNPSTMILIEVSA